MGFRAEQFVNQCFTELELEICLFTGDVVFEVCFWIVAKWWGTTSDSLLLLLTFSDILTH
jgi:hypothetical protein